MADADRDITRPERIATLDMFSRHSGGTARRESHAPAAG
jgi:hypothetical protein